MKRTVLIALLCVLVMLPSALFAGGKAEKVQPIDLNNLPVVDKNIEMTLTFLTHKQGWDAEFDAYNRRFNEIYPNVKIVYEPIGNYKDNIEIRWSSKDWGDLCMIPHRFLPQTQLPDLFAPIGKASEWEDRWEFTSAFAVNDLMYGVSSTGTAYGVLYNKKVLEQAGVYEFPKSPEEFFTALRKVKANTDAIPLYINYGAGSRLADWEWNARGTLTADPDYKNKLVYMENPFSTGKPYNTIMRMMYDVVQQGLVEEDPSTSKWDTAKNLLAQGKLAATVIGSWATYDTQTAADDPSDIVFAPFPWNIDGQQYATIAADYAYAINKNISPERYVVARDHIIWLTEQSNYSYDSGGIPIMKGQEYPATLSQLQKAGAILVLDNPSLPQDLGLFDEINNESEVYLDLYPQKARLIEAAMGQSNESFDAIMSDWNKRWTAAQIEVVGPDYVSKNPYK